MDSNKRSRDRLREKRRDPACLTVERARSGPPAMDDESGGRRSRLLARASPVVVAQIDILRYSASQGADRCMRC